MVVQVLWSISLGLTKSSILILYTKVFHTNSFILMSKITAILVFLWLVYWIPCYVFLEGLLHHLQLVAKYCKPGRLCLSWGLSSYADRWSITGTQRCPVVTGNTKVMWYVTGVFNIITDLMILLLPQPYLYSLELVLYKKLVLMVTFGIGLL